MTGRLIVPGDRVRLLVDGVFGGPDAWTERAGIVPGRTYTVADVVADRYGVGGWVILAGVPAPSWRYPGWAHSRFTIVEPARG